MTTTTATVMMTMMQHRLRFVVLISDDDDDDDDDDDTAPFMVRCAYIITRLTTNVAVLQAVLFKVKKRRR